MDGEKKIKLPISPQMRADIIKRFENKPEVKRPHSVPDFYLNRFEGNDRRVWVFDKADMRVFQAGSRDIAIAKDFFNSEWADAHFDEPDLPSGSRLMEEFYSEIEDKNAPIIDSLIKRVKNGQTHALTSDERYN